MVIGVNGRFLAAQRTGVQRWAYEVVGRLSQRADVMLFLPAGVAAPGEWNVRARRGRWSGQGWEQLELQQQARHGCDVLLNPANAAPLGLRRQVVMLHDVLPLAHAEWFSWPFATWYSLAVRRVARNADAILTSTEHAARSISAVTGVARERITVVPQGVAPFDAPAPAAEVERVLVRLGIRGRYALTLGAGDPRKNVGFAIDVVRAHALRSAEPLTLVIAGRAQPRVHGRAPQPEHADIVQTGHVSDDELRALYTGAAALLYPSLDEGFGRPPLEALCCGAPVLAADYAAGADVLHDTPALRLPLAVDAWVAALDGALRAARPSTAVQAQIAARWSWDAAADAVLAVCSNVSRGRSARQAG